MRTLSNKLHEHGITFAGADEDGFNLNPAVSGQIKDATIKGYPMVMRSMLGYTSASRASLGGQKSFEDATKFLVANMLRSIAKKLEIQVLYGQMGYAKAQSVDGTNTVVVIQTAEWAPGIWAGAEGMPIELRTAADVTVVRGSAVVKKVDMEARTITLDTAVAGILIGDYIYHKGAYGNEFPGIHKVLTSTGSLFGINSSDYNLWKAAQYDAAGALSFPKLNIALSRAVEKGLDTKVTVYVNPRAWANILNEQAGLRMYDQSFSSAELKQGSQSIKFFSQSGEMEIVPSIYIKEGFAFALDTECWNRVGSTDITFKRPGQGEEFFRDLENSAAYELRLWTDQAVFCSAPSRNVLIYGIINANS